MSVPSWWVRRLLIAPLVTALGLVLLVTVPVWLLVLLIITSLVPRRFRTPRVLLMVVLYLVSEALTLIVLFAMWVGTGFGWKLRAPASIRAHYRIGGAFLQLLFAVAGSVLRLRIDTIGSEGTPAAAARTDFERVFAPGTPLVVLSRHGGPGDSFILIHTLLNHAHRMPRIVLKDTLQWDPVVDVLLHRIPARFIAPTGFGGKTRGGGHGVEEQIGELATGMGDADAVVIFPEGGQATPRRRTSRIERYRSRGLEDLALRTEALRHVMPPQPGGVHAALQAAPTADVMFIAHTGLDKLASVRDVWRELPMDKHITMRAVLVPRRLIPEGRAEQAEWLFDWFEGIDAWIDAQG